MKGTLLSPKQVPDKLGSEVSGHLQEIYDEVAYLG